MTDSLYVKMILSLPEDFFKDWQWKMGDKALYSNGSLNFKPDPLSIICLGDNNHKSFLFCNGNLGYYKRGDFFEVDRIIKPVPSQIQLQSMLNLSPIEFIEDFYAYSQEPLKENVDPMQFKTDTECFTLAYVMEKKYNKIWNGENWVELKRLNYD